MNSHQYVQFNYSPICVVCNELARNPQMRRNGIKCNDCVGISSAYNYLVQQGPWMTGSPKRKTAESHPKFASVDHNKKHLEVTKVTQYTPLLNSY